MKETCKDSPHVEQNMASKEGRRRSCVTGFFFSFNTWGPGANVLRKILKCVAKISKCVAKILKCVAKISEFVVNSKCVSKNLECVVHNLKCELNNSKCVVK